MGVLIAPSILAADFSRLGDHVDQVMKGSPDWLHLDVMDGAFVPNISYGPPVIAAIRPRSHLTFDTHLMVQEPVRYVSDYRKCGADRITVHQEACKDLRGTIEKIRETGALAGVAINPDTPASAITDVLSLVDLVLVMTVFPGFGGQKFIADALTKIPEIRKASAAFGVSPLIEVDGGVDLSTARRCVEAGADVLVAGTSVFRTEDPGKAVTELRKAALRE